MAGGDTKTGRRTALLLCLVVPLIHGCHLPNSRPGGPTGQVIAVVDGKEITLQQLRGELSSSPSSPDDQRQQERAALKTLVNRSLIADHARKMGLDRKPPYVVALARAKDALLAQYYQETLIQQVPQPTPEEVEQFIDAHPAMYAHRKIYTIDQVLFNSKDADKISTDIRPMMTLAEIEVYLKGRGVDFKTSPGTLDTSKMPPELVDTIASLPAGEPFALRDGDATVVDAITGSQEVPLQGEDASRSARSTMRELQVRKAVSQGMDAVLKQGQANVRYNARFLASIQQPQQPAGHN